MNHTPIELDASSRSMRKILDMLKDDNAVLISNGEAVTLPRELRRAMRHGLIRGTWAVEPPE
jgi:hypothetical protein